MSVGYSFPALRGGGPGLGRGIVSFGFMGGGLEDPVQIIVCFDGNVRVRVAADGVTIERAVVAGDVQLRPAVSGDVRTRATVAGNVNLFPTVTGAVIGRC